MTSVVDFLPESYRRETARRARRREATWLAISITVCTVLVDLVFRARIGGLRRQEQLAIEDIDRLRRNSLELETLRQRSDVLRRELTEWTLTFDRMGMANVLDELLADRPTSVCFHDLQCTLGADASEPPGIQLDTSCNDLDDLSAYVQRIASSGKLPRLHFKRTQMRQEDGRQGFRLETEPEEAR